MSIQFIFRANPVRKHRCECFGFPSRYYAAFTKRKTVFNQYFALTDLLGKSEETNKIQVLENRIIKPAVLQSAVSVGDDKNGALNDTPGNEAVATNTPDEPEVGNSQTAASVDKPDKNDSLDSSAPNNSSKTLVAVCTIPVIVNLCESGKYNP